MKVHIRRLGTTRAYCGRVVWNLEQVQMWPPYVVALADPDACKKCADKLKLERAADDVVGRSKQ